jgi:DNA repair exonuclease SbcCD ATPase subunit
MILFNKLDLVLLFFLVKNNSYREILSHKEKSMTDTAKNKAEAKEVNSNNTTASTEKDPLPIPLDNDEIERLIKSVQTDEHGNFQKILITQDIFNRIRAALLLTIQSMEKNPSIISRAAEFWEPLPLWQKIIGGATLTLPMLILGLCFHIGFLLALCGVTTIIYTGSSIILDDHHKCSMSVSKDLAKGILGLASLLELTITALDKIRQQLADEVAKFSAENNRLHENVNNLKNRIKELGIEIAAAAELSKGLKTTKDELEKTVSEIKEKLGVQSEQLTRAQNELDKASEEYKTAEQQMTNRINELTTIKAELQTELEQLKKITNEISNSFNEALSNLTSLDENERKEYEKRLADFIANEASFTAIMASENKLKATQEEFEKHIQEQASQMMMLTQFIEKVSENPHIKQALSEIGFFRKSHPQQNRVNPKPDFAIEERGLNSGGK